MNYSKEDVKNLNKKTFEFLRLRDISEKSVLEELKSIIRFHEWNYYVKDNPLISDYEYDQLYKLLEQTETTHPQWISQDSPTQRVSSDLVDTLQSVVHLNPMLSLENSYNEEDLNEFDARVKKLCGLVDSKGLSCPGV
jgi:DNA ligase (NAD+)